MSAGQVSSGHTERTASWLDPESNQTSRMFISRSKPVEDPDAGVLPHVGHTRSAGTNSSVGLSYHESAPYCSKTAAVFDTSDGVVIAVPHFAQSTAGIGTPQTRWREMHQSGRFATMLYMRSCPHDGIHRTLLSTASIAASRSVRAPSPELPVPEDLSSAMNHCDVARKMTGLWQRQQCG